MVPHIARRLPGTGRLRQLLPCSALLGGALVTLADLLGRVLFAPSEIPAGIITALIGAPFFFALLLFLVGIVFCYASVFFLAIDFFMVSGDGLATPMLSLDKYINFLFGFLLPFGVAFMLPVFIYITTRIGLTTPEMLSKARKFVILGIFILAAILTPPDVVSQVMLGIPMLALYEVGILVSRLVKKQQRE